MATTFRPLKLALAQSIGPQRAPRVPEPSATMEAGAQVADYDRAGESKLALSYQAVLWYIARLPADWHSGAARVYPDLGASGLEWQLLKLSLRTARRVVP